MIRFANMSYEEAIFARRSSPLPRVGTRDTQRSAVSCRLLSRRLESKGVDYFLELFDCLVSIFYRSGVSFFT